MANTQINIGANGTTTLATAGKICDRNIDINVSVPSSGVTPTGTKTITSNGSHDVTAFATAQVNVPVGTIPTGTKTITTNGTHDVTSYASAVVNVPTPAEITVVRTVTLSADITGTGSTATLLSADPFIKQHYAENGFSAMWFLTTPVACATGVIHANYQGNRNIGSSSVTRTGLGFRSTSASAVTSVNNATAINGKGYAQHMRVNSNGDLLQYLNSGYILKAGTYQIILSCVP